MSDDEHVAAMRTKALSLLKSKMKRAQKPRAMRESESEHQLPSEQLVDDPPTMTRAAHEDGTATLELKQTRSESVTNLSLSAATIEDSAWGERSESTLTIEILESCNQRDDADGEMTIAELKQQTVIVYDSRSTSSANGHRYKEHPSCASDPRVKAKSSSSAFHTFACTSAKCSCKSFFYVVAEGAWILRCRCKHKHVEHDPSGTPYRCSKPKCGCAGFDSPWICNCDHPWASHSQEIVEKQFASSLLERLQEQCQLEELSAVQRTDLFTEPLQF